TAELERFEFVVLAFRINHQTIQKAPGHINDLEPSKNLIFPFFCRKLCGQVLHLINGLDGTIKQLRSAAVCKLCISDCFVQTDVLGNAPELIDGIGGVLRQNAVLKHEATAVMDGKGTILAEHLVVFWHTEP